MRARARSGADLLGAFGLAMAVAACGVEPALEVGAGEAALTSGAAIDFG
jgi:hypothetical protein